MATSQSTVERRFEDALERLGVSFTMVERAAVEAVNATPAQLTAAELEFAAAAGVPERAFTPRGRQDAATRRIVRSLADRAARGPRLTTNEVAELLGKAAANVRRMHGHGDLFAAGQVDRQTAYPAWQFTADHQVLPHLREVIAAFPSDYHPLDIETVMTSPLEELRGASPKEWLESGGKTAPLVTFIEDLSLS